MVYSDRDKQEAHRRLDADMYADDITPEEHAREAARIEAGSSRSEYLKAVGKERGAQREKRWWVAGGVATVLVIVVAAIFGGDGDDDDFDRDDDSPPVQQVQPYEDDDEGDEDDGD